MICGPCTRGDHCNSPSCFCQHRPRGTGQPEYQAAPEPSPVPVVQFPPGYVETGRSADPDLYVSPGFNDTVKDVPTLSLLADWMRAVRAGQRARAAVLHGALASRLRRLT